jgi:hypothetical protein
MLGPAGTVSAGLELNHLSSDDVLTSSLRDCAFMMVYAGESGSCMEGPDIEDDAYDQALAAAAACDDDGPETSNSGQATASEAPRKKMQCQVREVHSV